MSLRSDEKKLKREHRALLRRRRKAIEHKHFGLGARLGIKARRVKQKAANIHRRRVGTFRSSMLDGHPGNVADQVKRFVALAYRFAEERGTVCTVTATTDGTHAVNSWHYHHPLGWAVDLIFPTVALMEEFQTWVVEKTEDGELDWLELFGPANFYVKNGERVPGHFPDHGDHVHGAPDTTYRR